ncbi:MAG: hypothetical protein HY822_12050 [Acidobacteria bacterium]|nr:hypothetical protein [Acidobacteriota bacterium]
MSLPRIEALRQWAAIRGYSVAWGPLTALDDVRSEIERRLQAGEIDPAFYQAQIATLQDSAPEDLPRPKSVLVVAVPRPAHTVRFTFDSGPLDAVLPPTYVRYRGLPEDVLEDLKAHVLQDSFRLSILSAPLKALAGRLGLIAYGRNNITYVPGLGSYFQLAGFLTDAALELPENWRPQPARPLPECESCSSCLSSCPTGAIAEERFLLHAERCLTLPTENAGDWPEWFSPSMHRCLIGCLACQQACPENAGRLRFEPSGIVFNAEETAAILSGDRLGNETAWESIWQKIEAVRMTHFEPVLSRNLRALAE